MALVRRGGLPGFGLALGTTTAMLGLLVVLPLGALVAKAAGLTWAQFAAAAFAPRTLAAYALSFGTAFIAATVSAVFGFLVAWVLARYEFPGRRVVDALVDLPFALPTAVAGISLTMLYAPNGWLGKLLLPLGIKVAFTPLGITVALIFLGIPFVVRTVQPVIQELEAEVEEAAASLGAGRWETFRRVLLPATRPAVLTGFALAFARAVGEYGSVVFISGNMPMKTEIAPLLIMSRLEQFDYAGAAAVAVMMLVVSFALLLAINLLQARASDRALAG
jgi:sulfate transport system permease protein